MAFTISVAALTFSTSSPLPEVPEEYDNIATLGSIPNAKLESADEIAISANCSAVGFGLIAQSPKTETLSSKHIKNTEETTDELGLVLIN